MRLAWIAGLLAVAACSGGNRPALERTVNALTGTHSPPPPPKRVEPDVSYVKTKWGPMQLAPGGAGLLEIDVVNRGEKPSGPFRVAVYATLGRVVTADRTLIGSAEVASLTNQTPPQRVAVALTAPSSPGTYAVGIEIDDRLQVPGDDRANNTSGPWQLIVR